MVADVTVAANEVLCGAVDAEAPTLGCRYSPLMKAAVHTSYGPPNVVRIAEVEKPAAKDNQVLVKVHATTVNRTDSGLRAAFHQ